MSYGDQMWNQMNEGKWNQLGHTYWINPMGNYFCRQEAWGYFT